MAQGVRAADVVKAANLLTWREVANPGHPDRPRSTEHRRGERGKQRRRNWRFGEILKLET
jgi:hypothetical protein